MARRSHLPPALAHVEEGSPNRAVLVVGALVLLLVLIGDVRTTWGLSAVTVLLYYAITNLSALRLPAGQRRFWRWLPWAGLMACVGLAFFVDPLSWMAGAGIVTMGTAVSIVSRRMSGSP
jgi:APA family basic amino acid/polyamine antiporter